MLPKKNRINTALFKDVFQKGKIANSPHFFAKITASPAAKVSKISFTVPKKISNKAVVRNRLRRRAYAAAETLILSPKLPFNAIFVVKNDFSEVPIGDLEREISDLLMKIKVA